MQKIKKILENNKNNSNETKALDRLESMDIKYIDDDVIINGNNIRIATIISKMLADNESNITSSSWLTMLAKGYTNQNKWKAGNTAKPDFVAKSVISLVSETETTTMSACDFKAHKLGLYNQFSSELEVLLARYGVTCFDTLLTAEDIFTLQDAEEYGQKVKDETVSNEILEKITLPYISVTRNNGHIIVVLDDCNRISEIKHFMIDLEDHFINLSRADMVVTFKEYVA